MYPNVRENNPRFPHTCVITRPAVNSNPLEDEQESVVIYEGQCRSFDFHTTDSRGEVITSTRKLSLPVRQNEWVSIDDNSSSSTVDLSDKWLIPLEGDSIIVDKGSHREYGIVVDKMPSNLGTHLIWRFVRN